MARTKGAKNKPKDISEPVEVKKVAEVPKPEIKNFVEKPQTPKIEPPIIIPSPEEKVKKSIPKPQPKPKATLQLEQIQEPISPKGLNKKWVILGLLGVSVIGAYFMKDKLLEKYIDWKANRELDKCFKEGIEDIKLDLLDPSGKPIKEGA